MSELNQAQQQRLLSYCRKLIQLTNAPEPGIATWNAACAEIAQGIAELFQPSETEESALKQARRSAAEDHFRLRVALAGHALSGMRLPIVTESSEIDNQSNEAAVCALEYADAILELACADLVMLLKDEG